MRDSSKTIPTQEQGHRVKWAVPRRYRGSFQLFLRLKAIDH